MSDWATERLSDCVTHCVSKRPATQQCECLCACETGEFITIVSSNPCILICTFIIVIELLFSVFWALPLFHYSFFSLRNILFKIGIHVKIQFFFSHSSSRTGKIAKDYILSSTSHRWMYSIEFGPLRVQRWIFMRLQAFNFDDRFFFFIRNVK